MVPNWALATAATTGLVVDPLAGARDVAGVVEVLHAASPTTMHPETTVRASLLRVVIRPSA